MAQKRKKTAQPSPKQREAEQFKLFCSKLKAFFEACNHGELYPLIEPKILKDFFKFRFHPPRIDFDEKLRLSSKEKEEHVKFFYYLLKNSFINVPFTENRVSSYDLITSNYDGFLITKPPTGIKNEKIQHVVETMQPILDILHDDSFIFESQWRGILFLIFNFTQLGKYNIQVNLDLIGCHKSNLHPQFKFSIRAIECPQIQVNLDGHNRPAFQLGWATNDGFSPVTLSSESLSLDPVRFSDPIPVYLQNHAIARLKERMDVMDNFYLTASAIESFKKPEPLKIGKNQYLVAFKLENYRLGYFKADFHDNKLIVRTFLLPTCCGTPEETKLRALTGLKKSDYEFLNLGKLSSLVCSDFHKNERICALLEEAGFKSILDYARENESMINNPISLSDRFLNYLQTDYAVYSL